MPNRKLFASLLFILIFFFTLVGSCSISLAFKQEKAIKGVFELQQDKLDKNIIKLDGEWEFYWQRLLEPKDFFDKTYDFNYVDLPNSWNGYKINNISGKGYATYRLLLNAEQSGRLALKLPRILTAYKLWINNDLIASAGSVGQDRASMIPQYLPQVAFFEVIEGTNEIILQVSNYYHRSGGLLESILLGREENILHLRYKSIALELFLFGSLLLMGLYHLALFYFRRKYYPPLYFGLFCILIAVRTLLVGERFLICLLPSFNWELAHKIQTNAFYITVPLVMMFFKTLFPQDINTIIYKITLIVGSAFSALVILTPARIFTPFNPFYQIFALLVILYLTYFLIKKARQREKGVIFIIIGALFLFFTSINDIVFLSIWLNDSASSFLRFFFRTGNLSSYGQLVFAFTQSLLLAQNFSRALEQEEVTSIKLKEMNLNLDELVKKRTQALEESKREIAQQKAELEETNRVLYLLSLKDPLTNLWNRRHFDETFQLEWNRALRYKRPLSLMIIDVDNFKEYNDHYGHKAGDECLVKVAQTLKNAFKRGTDLVARYGGEEFVIIMAETNREDAIKRAEFIRNKIESMQIPHERSPVSSYITVSIGVSTLIPDANTTSSYLFEMADQALYQVKIGSRNNIAYLDHDLFNK
ncbi:MAG: diguanylate cyclase [Firmicutes bacterium]|nr:diguanylate cyclase [Bacillota bacterium]